MKFSVTPQQFASMRDAADKAGFQLEGTYGVDVPYDHCKFSWSYDASQQVLTIECTGKPFFVAMDTVNSHITSMVAQYCAAEQPGK